jgi:cytochrome c
MAAGMVLLITACGDKTEDVGAGKVTAPLLTAETLGDQTVLTAAEYLLAPPYSGADRSNGANLAQICRACHSLDEGGANMIGPALYGFFGAGVGSRADFDYSPALRDADFVWTPRALGAWLAQPSRFLPGNRMTFAGVLQSGDREDLIAYLLEVTTADGGR